MQYIRRMILAVLLVATVFSGTVVSAATTNLPAGMLIGDQDGLRVNKNGEYFIEAEGLEAGDVIKKQLTIFNTESYSWKLTMKAEPLEETGPLKLLDEVRCTIRFDGIVLYDGRVRGDGNVNMIQNALDIGIFESGIQKTLDITLTVNPEMKKYYWTVSESFFKWNFYAEQTEIDISDDPPLNPPDGPKTGDDVRIGLYFTLSGISLIMIILIIIKRYRSERQIND